VRAQVQRHLEAITAWEGPELALADKLGFMRETRHAFGRTALVLSGGGALGAFHIVRAPLFCFPSMFPPPCAAQPLPGGKCRTALLLGWLWALGGL
jgi:hypothetical protein